MPTLDLLASLSPSSSSPVFSLGPSLHCHPMTGASPSGARGREDYLESAHHRPQFSQRSSALHPVPPLASPALPRQQHQPVPSAASSPFGPDHDFGRKRSFPADSPRSLDQAPTRLGPASTDTDGGDSRGIPSPADSASRSVSGQKVQNEDLDGAAWSLGAATAAGNKRRRVVPGSRGVASLTAEQLAKKRANGMLLFSSSALYLNLARYNLLFGGE